MHFGEEEVLSIWAPRDLHIGPSRLRSEPILRIRDAERVRWEWPVMAGPHRGQSLL